MAKNSVADWSTTAASNSDVGGINIAEGCPAANINDAQREMMAQIKTYSGTIPALATVNTYTKIQKWAKGADVASASTLTLGDDGNYFDVTGTTTITSIATKGVGTVVLLQFDGALILTHNATDLILPGGANITTAAGDHAEFIEYATGDWRCTNYERSSGIPVVDATPAGAVTGFARNTAPTGWLKANGAAVSRTTYATLFSAIGTTFGTGDGSTTFNVPDMRGEFPRGWDDSRGVDSGRVFGSAQLDQFQGHRMSGVVTGGNVNSMTTGSTNNIATLNTGNSGPPADDGTNGTPRIGTETRGRNVALLFCIKF